MNLRYLSFMSGAMAALLFASPDPVFGNLLKNGDFKSGLDHWTISSGLKDGAVRIERLTPGSPVRACRVEAKEKQRISVRQEFPVEGGKIYRVRLSYRTEGSEEPDSEAAATNELAELNPNASSSTLRFAMQSPEGTRATIGRSLCYVGNEAFAPTFGQWREIVVYLRAHPYAGSCVMEMNVIGLTLSVSDPVIEEANPEVNEKVLAFSSLPSAPLYKELFTDEKRDAAVFPNWTYNFDQRHYHDYGLKFGWKYRYRDQFEEAGRLGLSVFKSDELSREFKVAELYSANNSTVIQAGSRGRGHDFPFLHPEKKRLMLKALQARLKGEAPLPYAVFYADEPFYHSAPVPARRYKEDETYWKSIDLEVRKKYGRGKYGIPQGDGLGQPFQWIAFRRWADEQLYTFFQDLQKEIRSSDESIRIIGPNELSTPIPRDWERLSETWDYTSGQSLPAWNAVYKNYTGFLTKLYGDLSFKPTMPFIQISAYDHASTPELVQDHYSQALRSGAELFWINGVEWYDRELNHPKYNAPDRWLAMTELIETVRNTPRLRQPIADTAIFYSLDTEQAVPRIERGENAAGVAYVYLGPEAGSWFHFVSEPQVIRESRRLADYKVIYLPNVRHLRSEVIEALEKYVREGGTLICGDPFALETDDFGESMIHWREKIFGIATDGVMPATPMIAHQVPNGPMLGEGTEVPVLSSTVRLQITSPEDTVKLMSFADGSPALTLRTLGKGRALYLATNPFNVRSASQRQWQKCFRELQIWAGCKVDEKIWRFTLPLSAPQPKGTPEEELVCLTGNHVEMKSSVVFHPNNAAPDNGHYRYSLPPAQEGANGEPIPFSSGRLTNRAKAYEHAIRGHQKVPKGHQRNALDDWSISWDRKDAPLGIRFSFGGTESLRKLCLFVSGNLPALSVSSGGKEIARRDACEQAEGDVMKVELELSGQYQDVDLKIDTPEKGGFRIAEIEFWGERQN